VRILEEVQEFPIFIKRELILGVIFAVIGPMLMPITTKLQGLELAVVVIGILQASYGLIGVITYFIKKWDMTLKYIIVLVSQALSLIPVIVYYVDKIYFIYSVTITGIIIGISFSAFYVDFDVLVSKKLDKERLSNFMYIERFIYSGVSFISTMCAGYLASISIDLVMIVYTILVLVGLAISIGQYKLYYNKESLRELKKI
jgi:hypothetical protein